MSDRIVRPTFSTSRNLIAPAQAEYNLITAGIAFAFAAAFYTALFYGVDWVMSWPVFR